MSKRCDLWKIWYIRLDTTHTVGESLMSRACCYCDVTCWFPGDRFCRAQNIQPKYQQNLFLIYVGLRNVPFKATFV